jgi:hypothetical protein
LFITQDTSDPLIVAQPGGPVGPHQVHMISEFATQYEATLPEAIVWFGRKVAWFDAGKLLTDVRRGGGDTFRNPIRSRSKNCRNG